MPGSSTVPKVVALAIFGMKRAESFSPTQAATKSLQIPSAQSLDPNTTARKKRAIGIEPSGLGLFANQNPVVDDPSAFTTPMSSPIKPTTDETANTIFGSLLKSKSAKSQFSDTPSKGGGGFADMLAAVSTEIEDVEPGKETDSVALPTFTKKDVILTGEENDKTIFQARAKLFHFDSSQSWKERGIGMIKLLKDSTTHQQRLVMRTEGVLRLILNVKVNGVAEIVQDKYVRTIGTEEGGIMKFLIKFSTASAASECLSAITSVRPKTNGKSIDTPKVPARSVPKSPAKSETKVLLT